MKFLRTPIPGIVICEPKVFSDERGYLSESYRKDKLDKFLGYKINFCQDITSKSKKGIFRGLHFQTPPKAQSKLVRVIKGSVLDIAVDLRSDSSTYGKHISIELSAENHKQLFIPRGFAHGFLSLEDSIFSYKVDNFYSRENDKGLFYKDESLNIHLNNMKNIEVSTKDKKLPLLSNIKEYFKKTGDLYE